MNENELAIHKEAARVMRADQANPRRLGSESLLAQIRQIRVSRNAAAFPAQLEESLQRPADLV
jgi:hypothetical protein